MYLVSRSTQLGSFKWILISLLCGTHTWQVACITGKDSEGTALVVCLKIPNPFRHKLVDPIVSLSSACAVQQRPPVDMYEHNSPVWKTIVVAIENTYKKYKIH